MVLLAVNDHDGDVDCLGVGGGACEEGIEVGSPGGVFQDEMTERGRGNREFSMGVFFDELIEVGERGDGDAGAEAGFAGEGLEDDGATEGISEGREWFEMEAGELFFGGVEDGGNVVGLTGAVGDVFSGALAVGAGVEADEIVSGGDEAFGNGECVFLDAVSAVEPEDGAVG